MSSGHAQHADRNVIRDVLPACVQIVALRQQFFGNLSSAWTGSGTVVDPSGIILTNCHVANPRAMGMPSPPADRLGIAVNERSDEPPVLTYFAEIVAQSPELDLAVLRIVEGLDKKPIRRLNLPHLPVGDSNGLELGDILSIFGFPGIGGETVTFTSGNVAGFTKQKGVRDRRAWIKTDATIAGGNSGGTAVNNAGELVGIPTQAAAGTGITPVDARPVVDTNRDGRVDQRDTPMAIGGFINGLRPVNLAKPLLEKAGVSTKKRSTRSRSGSTNRSSGSSSRSSGSSSRSGSSRSTGSSRRAGATRGGSTRGSSSRTRPAGSTTTPKKTTTVKKPTVSNLAFSSRVTRDGRPINPTATIRGRHKQLYVSFDFDNMRNRTKWSQTWTVNGKVVHQEDGKWEDGPRGRKTLTIGTDRGYIPEGEYHFAMSYRNQIVAEGKATVGNVSSDRDIEISGQVVDQDTGRGIANALLIVLKPNVRAADFVRTQDKNMSFTSARTNRSGRFTLKKQLPKGQSYGLVAIARGYRDTAIDGALRISNSAPEKATINPLPLMRE